MKESDTQTELIPEEAEANKIARQEALLDKINRSLDKGYPQSVKPGKIFEKFHKTRKKRTRKQIYDKAMAYINQKRISDAINTEEATPLDESF